MFRSISMAFGLAVLASTASAQDNFFCGGQVSPLMPYGSFSAAYNHTGNFTVLTMNGQANNQQLLLYCGNPVNLQEANLSTTISQFQVPVSNVATSGTFTSSYVELFGRGNSIMFMDNPALVVSPCLQARYANKTLSAWDASQYAQYGLIQAAFLDTPVTAPSKGVYVPQTLEVAPLQRAEYIVAISLFYGMGAAGQNVYNQITSNYNALKEAVAGIPQDQRKRIAWMEYDFSYKVWRIRNSQFTRAIIQDAGGISFPLRGDGVADRSSLAISDLQTMIRNSWVVIDQTNFTGQHTNQGDISTWRSLTGLTNPDDFPAKRIYALDGTYNYDQGDSDYDYRAPSRPDLLLQDLIHAQYNTFKSNFTFVDNNFVYGGTPPNAMKSDMCGQAFYNDAPIVTYSGGPFAGDGIASPPLVGSGIYGAESGGGGNSGGQKSKTPIIVAVVVVAAVLGSAFAFAFFKWGKRAKEDRFIELEEEMNNDIPLH